MEEPVQKRNRGEPSSVSEPCEPEMPVTDHSLDEPRGYPTKRELHEEPEPPSGDDSTPSDDQLAGPKEPQLEEGDDTTSNPALQAAGMVEVEVGGDLLLASERYILHQVNCVSKSAKGLAKKLFQAWPEADIFMGRKEKSIPGTVAMTPVLGLDEVPRTIVHLFAQRGPGKPKKGHGDDSKERRLKWFRASLENFAAEVCQIDPNSTLWSAELRGETAHTPAAGRPGPSQDHRHALHDRLRPRWRGMAWLPFGYRGLRLSASNRCSPVRHPQPGTRRIIRRGELGKRARQKRLDTQPLHRCHS